MKLGERFESEIREQPEVWRRIATSSKAADLAEAVGGSPVVLVGSGSSLFVAMLGALSLRRRGIAAAALAASEARSDRAAYAGSCCIALSQSGRSADVLEAIDVLSPRRLVVLTNTPASPLASRCDLEILLEAGPERAVPASKSVTAMAAILLWAAALIGGNRNRNAETLAATAGDIEAWMSDEGWQDVAAAARRLAYRRTVAIVGTGYGVPVAYEAALKMKEASYVHAEGFPAGEFRHGSSAILDSTSAIVGIVDAASRKIVARPLDEARRAGALRFTIGSTIDDIPAIGPTTGDAFNTLDRSSRGKCWRYSPAGSVKSIATPRADCKSSWREGPGSQSHPPGSPRR